MKGTLLVLLELPVDDLDAAVARALAPHRLDEDDLESIRGHHWDAWFHPEAPSGDPALAATLPAGSRAAAHARRLRDLPDDDIPSALIDPAGTWHDLQDHGWRLLREPSPDNEAALARWHAHVRALRARHGDALAVEVIVHG